MQDPMSDSRLRAMSEKPARIHVTGGPGSGKTRLAKRIADERGIPMHDLDGLLLTHDDVGPLDASGDVGRLVDMPQWVSEGVYVTWSRPFLDAADVIVWLDPPWRVASYRILSRHLRLELARKNRFPGWRRLYHFWRWSARFYANTNEPTVNRYGAPNTCSALEAGLEPYRAKLIVCRTNEQIEALVKSV